MLTFCSHDLSPHHGAEGCLLELHKILSFHLVNKINSVSLIFISLDFYVSVEI